MRGLLQKNFVAKVQRFARVPAGVVELVRAALPAGGVGSVGKAARRARRSSSGAAQRPRRAPPPRGADPRRGRAGREGARALRGGGGPPTAPLRQAQGEGWCVVAEVVVDSLGLIELD